MKHLTIANRSLILSLTAAMALSAGACEEPLPERSPRAYGTFGQEMYRLMYREFLWSGTPTEGDSRAAAFAGHQAEVTWAFDSLTAGKVDAQMLPLLEVYLPLYEEAAVSANASIPTLTRDSAAMMQVLRDEDGLVTALASASGRPRAYPNALVSLLGAVVRHETALVDRLLTMTHELKPGLTDLFSYLARELPTVEDATPLEPGQRTLAARLMELELESGGTPVGPPTFAARIDDRGAFTAGASWSAAGHPGLVDQDQDGRPDVDDRGRFVDALGKYVDLQPFAGASNAGGAERDAFGRALLNGHFLFDYVDLRKSVLSFVLRDMRKLVERDAHFDFFTTVSALIGTREERDDADGRFMGYRVSQSPLLDVVHVLNDLRNYPRITQLVRSLEHVATEREILFRQIVQDLAKTMDIMKDAPALKEGMRLVEDLLPVIQVLAANGGLRSLMATAGLPETADLVPSLKTMMSRSEMNLPSDMAVLEVPADVNALTFRGAVDWSIPDTTDAQRSWFHKATYLIADTNHAPAFLRLLDLIDVPDIAITSDMAALYMEAIAGKAKLDLGDPFLENLTITTALEFDDLFLAAEELNLFMNHNQTVLGNPRGLQGIAIRNLYGPALLALQTSRGLRALRPWVTRMVDAGHTRDIVDVLVTLANHYSETVFTVPGIKSEGTGIRAMEPFILRIFDETRLVPRILELSAWMHTANFTHNGAQLNVADEMDAFLLWFLDPDAGVRTRTGLSAIPSARGGMITKPSRAMLAIHALDTLDVALEADPAARAAWDRMDLTGVFLNIDSSGELENRHILDLLVAVMPVLADYVEQQVSRAEWSRDVRAFVPDLTDFVASRGFTALVDMMSAIRDTASYRALADDLLGLVLAEEPARADADVMGGLLRVAASLAHDRAPVDMMRPMMRAMGRILEPSKRMMFNLVDTLRAMRALDPEVVTNDLMINLVSEPEVGRIPLVSILDSFEAGLRGNPGGPSILDVGEWRVILDKLVTWFRDEDKGAERLYRVILSR